MSKKGSLKSFNVLINSCLIVLKKFVFSINSMLGKAVEGAILKREVVQTATLS